MADESLASQLATGLSNGAKSWWDGAKWVTGNLPGPQPPMYAGGDTYPSPKQSEEYLLKAQTMLKQGLISPQQFEQLRVKMSGGVQ